VVDVKRVSDLMRSIAEASAEQSRGVQQVNKTVTEMDKVVQQNASAVQQSAAAAQAMRMHAETMVRAVSAFRLGDEAVAAAMPAAAAVIAAAKASTTLPAPTPPRGKQLAVAAPHDDWEQF
jgi:methyl-accepting chemotaxis protein